MLFYGCFLPAAPQLGGAAAAAAVSSSVFADEYKTTTKVLENVSINVAVVAQLLALLAWDCLLFYCLLHSSTVVGNFHGGIP